MIKSVFITTIVLLSGIGHASNSGGFDKAFKSAGFVWSNGEWLSKCGIESNQIGAAYQPGSVSLKADFNGDELTDLLITEGGSFCAGNTGSVSYVLIQDASSNWRLVKKLIGIVELKERNKESGWLDFELGGPGFCFPIYGYKNNQYKVIRHEYQGKPCKN
jgi:hypothetical protein